MAKIQTRARAVDMLGRQQIAGIQNALSELFKNAHDAYADDIKVDFFDQFDGAESGFLVIRDDGTGMTRNDFEQKWLVLGTESKAGASRQGYRPPDKPERPITGEKGIGRLAIALLGNQTLILTRAERGDEPHDLVVALVHWGLFEVPGLNLEEIDIPVVSFSGDGLPGANDLANLREQLSSCARRIKASHEEADLGRIVQEIETFQPDLQALYAFLKSRDDNHMTLADGACGTHFLIGPSNESIRADIETEEKNDDYSFRRLLLGFCDTVFESAVEPRIRTSFRHWKTGDIFGQELLDPSTFFTSQELTEKSDHLLIGAVDEFGQFSGTLRVYNEEYPNLNVPWNENAGRKTVCGPFKISFGYLMGRSSESRLAPADFNSLNAKLSNVGGMYVYRDQIRILPYGDYSMDWLEVEKRRNKGAGYYFFSFRRMFGAVILSRDANHELQEKAGREGFQQNQAYRELRNIVINLLLNLAAEFFRKDGANTALFEKNQAEIRKRSEALEKQQKQSLTKRKNFSSALAKFSNDVTTGLPEAEVANLRHLTRSRMDAASAIADQDKAAAALIRAEHEAVTSINALRQRYTQKRPTGIALTKDLQRDWDAYNIERTRLEENVFAPFEQEISDTLGVVATQAKVYVDQRKRLEERIKALADDRRRQLAEASRQANATASDTRQTVFKITERARQALDETVRSIQVDLNRTDLSRLDPEAVDRIRKNWEEQLTEIEARHRDALIAARDMLASLAENMRSSDGEQPAQIMEALEERVLALEDQADEDFEMVQLGLAVAIINHEFAASIKRVRQSVSQLGQISQRSDVLRPVYESIRSNFEHLDGHLNLFTPLQRRLNRISQKISGAAIRNYAADLFSNRLSRHNVELRTTSEFDQMVINCYPSTLYPAVINIVDNAIHWLDECKGSRVVELSADRNSIYISNNGPSIEARDADRIFERGFSRRTSGRGLGLFISARALAAEKMTLTLDQPPRAGFSVTFKIELTSSLGEI